VAVGSGEGVADGSIVGVAASGVAATDAGAAVRAGGEPDTGVPDDASQPETTMSTAIAIANPSPARAPGRCAVMERR
jgi:hypothetical protein